MVVWLARQAAHRTWNRAEAPARIVKEAAVGVLVLVVLLIVPSAPDVREEFSVLVAVLVALTVFEVLRFAREFVRSWRSTPGAFRAVRSERVDSGLVARW